MLEWLTTTDIERLIIAALSIMGAASVLVAAMQRTIDPLQRWAESTASKTDDNAVALFAKVVNWTAKTLQVLKFFLAAISVRPSKAPSKPVGSSGGSPG